MTTTLTPPTTKRRVPGNALFFEAALSEVASAEIVSHDDGRSPPPVPITIRARTSGLAYQEFWGACVHDMAGYIPPTGELPLNYAHDRKDLIGSTPPPQVVEGELIAFGQLTPFAPFDRASEVIHKRSLKVPYQASIQLDLPSLVVEEVPEGRTVNVNGQDFEGPLVVFRRWGLEAISICPFGADSKTSFDFSRGGEFDVTCFSAQGSPTMADTPPADEKKTEPSAFAAWAMENFAMDEATMTDEQKAKFAAAFAAIPPKEAKPPVEEKPPVEKKDGDFAATAKRMLADFGAPGAVWAAEGKSYDDAAGLFRASQTEKLTVAEGRIKELETKLAEAERKGNFHRGHQTPAKFQPPVDETKKTESKTDFTGHTEARKKFIASIERRFAAPTNPPAN